MEHHFNLPVMPEVLNRASSPVFKPSGFPLNTLRELLRCYYYFEYITIPASCKNFIYRDMADVPKSLYLRYVEVSEATFQALLKNHSAGNVQHSKPIHNFSSPYKGFEGCLPCHLLQHLGIGVN
jgi:hypothetical protein